MVLYYDQMFNTRTSNTALTALNAGTTTAAGTYAPQLDGRLVSVTIGMGGQAATSLIEQIRVELSQSNWTPNIQRFVAFGNGIRTAPATPVPLATYVVDLPVKTSWAITGNYLFADAATTPNVVVLGGFVA